MTKKQDISPGEAAARKVEAQRKRNLRRLWLRSDLTIEEIADEMEISVEEVAGRVKKAGLGERGYPVFFMPNPEQIRLATAAIRAKWSPAELEARREGGGIR